MDSTRLEPFAFKDRAKRALLPAPLPPGRQDSSLATLVSNFPVVTGAGHTRSHSEHGSRACGRVGRCRDYLEGRCGFHIRLCFVRASLEALTAHHPFLRFQARDRRETRGSQGSASTSTRTRAVATIDLLRWQVKRIRRQACPYPIGIIPNELGDRISRPAIISVPREVTDLRS